MVALRKIRHQITQSVRRLVSSPNSTARSAARLFFWPRKFDNYNANDTLPTPDSSRSVSFEDAVSWPFIDEDVDNA
ncbi:hypothetical protein QR680_002710 [Steinernema hermaphroditum]|uniref:Uncharacterized protein n=1 Tax=Steinernema hermaphroditum TaxID=289476 RepID=A0AA39LIT0_9BILA|nr:hypothetical protein QR680_002710 [Steinernema hermaphroditum]